MPDLFFLTEIEASTPLLACSRCGEPIRFRMCSHMPAPRMVHASTALRCATAINSFGAFTLKVLPLEIASVARQKRCKRVGTVFLD